MLPPSGGQSEAGANDRLQKSGKDACKRAVPAPQGHSRLQRGGVGTRADAEQRRRRASPNLRRLIRMQIRHGTAHSHALLGHALTPRVSMHCDRAGPNLVRMLHRILLDRPGRACASIFGRARLRWLRKRGQHAVVCMR